MVKKDYKIIILLVIVASLVFINIFRNSFVYDDIFIVRDNAFLSDFSNVKELLNNENYFKGSRERSYWPVITFSYFVNYFISKSEAWGYHLGNLFFHIIATILVYLIMKLTFRERLTALLAGLFFAVHPVHTESVTWICGRTDLVSGVFFFLAFFLYIRQVNSKPAGRVYYVLSILSFLAALFSKEMAITLPLVLILYDYCFVSGKAVLKPQSIRRYAGYFITALVFLVVRFAFFSVGPIARGYPEGGVVSILMTFCKVLLVYIRLLFVPVNLCADYNILVSTSILDKGILTSIIAVLAVIAGSIILAGRSRKAAFGVFYFFLTLAPVSNIVPFGIIISERYLYIPSLGFCMIMAMLVTRVYRLIPGKGSAAGKAVVAGAAVVLLLFSVITVNRNADWKTGITLWASVARRFPDNPRAYNNLGNAYVKEERYEEAIEQFNKAKAIRPNDAGTYYNLGIVYGKLGLFDKANEQFELVRRLDPDYELDSSVIGNLYYKKGDYGEALNRYRESIARNPDSADAYFNLASTYSMMENYDEAEKNYRLATEKNPGHFEAYNNLGVMYRKKGLARQAIEEFKKAIEINPEYFDSHFNLGMCYSSKDWNKMISHLETACSLKPGQKELHYNLAIAYQNSGQAEAAINEYLKEIELNPGYGSSYKNLGILYHGKGDNKKAVHKWRKYLELAPDAPDAESIRKEINRLERQ